MKKIVPLLIVFLGLALIITAFVIWFEPPKDGGVFSTAGAIISFLLGASTSIKGWKDLFKKDDAPANTQTQTQDQSQTQSQVIHVHNYPPNSQSPITNYQHPLYPINLISSVAPKNLKQSHLPYLTNQEPGAH